MDKPRAVSPMNPMPPIILAFALAIFGMEMLFQLGERGIVGGTNGFLYRYAANLAIAVPGDLIDQALANRRMPPRDLFRFISYPFVHGNFTHMLFVVALFLALGKLVGEKFGPLAVLALFYGSSIAGALAYVLLSEDLTPLAGGFPVVYGFVGAFTYLLWVDLELRRSNRMWAFSFIGVLMGVQLLFVVLFDGGSYWIADAAGFAAGFALSFVVSPGGWSRILAMLRQR